MHKKKKFKKSKKNSNDMYNAYTRQACNFVFPYINKTINGENRPRPNMFRKSLKAIENDIQKLSRNKLKIKNNDTKKALQLYQKECNL